MTGQHIPTTDQLIDQLTVRLESDEPDQTEAEALTKALQPLEDYRASSQRVEALTAGAELSIAVRRHTRKATR